MTNKNLMKSDRRRNRVNKGQNTIRETSIFGALFHFVDILYDDYPSGDEEMHGGRQSKRRKGQYSSQNPRLSEKQRIIDECFRKIESVILETRKELGPTEQRVKDEAIFEATASARSVLKPYLKRFGNDWKTTEKLLAATPLLDELQSACNFPSKPTAELFKGIKKGGFGGPMKTADMIVGRAFGIKADAVKKIRLRKSRPNGPYRGYLGKTFNPNSPLSSADFRRKLYGCSREEWITLLKWWLEQAENEFRR